MSYEPYYGEIMLWPIPYAPEGWAFCDGRLIPIVQNYALYSLLGTRFGGDGRTTFALPDLRGRVPVGAGAGTELTPRDLGEAGAMDVILCTATQLPEVTGAPANTVFQAPMPPYVPKQPPYLSLNYVIALQGVYPPRSDW